MPGIDPREQRKRRAARKCPDSPGRKVPAALWHRHPAAVKAAPGWMKAPSERVLTGEALKHK